MKPKTEKLLDTEFSINVRLRAIEKDGLVPCFTCGGRLKWYEISLGHWKKRRFLRARYSYLNCKPQCYPCNGEKDGNDEVFEKKLRRIHGDEVIDQFVLEVHEHTRISENEAQSQLQKLRNENRKLKNKLGT